MFASGKHFAQLLILILIFVKISQAFYIVKQDNNRTSQLNKSIVKIIKKLPGIVHKISFFTSDGNSDLALDILLGIRVPVLINAIEGKNRSEPFLEICNSIVIIFSENPNVNWVLDNVLWNTDTKFLVVADVRKVDFKDFWKKSVVNAFVLTEEEKGISLYSFLPYNAGACNDVKPILLGKWKGNTFTNGGLSKLYDNQRIKDMHGCIVNISVINLKPIVYFTDGCIANCSGIKNVDGTEVRIMKVIQEKLNFIARYAMPADGERFGGFTPPKGILGEVHTGQSKFGLGSITPLIDRFENLDLSRFYRSKSCVTFTVPVGAGRGKLAWLDNITNEFTLLQWMLIVVSLVCVALIFWTASNFDFSKSFLYSLELLLGISTTVPKRGGLKILMLFWMIFSLLVANMYQGAIGSQIAVPFKPPEINTLAELGKSDLIIMGPRNMHDLSTNIDPIRGLKEINKRIIITRINVNKVIQRMVTKKDIAVGGPKSAYIYAVLNNPKAQGKIRTLKECAYEFFPAIALQKNSPFTKETNKILARLFDSGLSEYWAAVFVQGSLPEIENFVPMTLDETWGIIALFVLGASISSLVFVAEVVFGPKKRKDVAKVTHLRKRNMPKNPHHFLFLNR